MDFGKVENIDAVDFTLLSDHPETSEVLATAGGKSNKPEVYVGCAKWGRKEWIGKIYPKGTKAGDYLEFYGKHYNSIELNAVYHRLPPEEWIKKWNRVTPDDFKFFPKLFQAITHWDRLKNAERNTETYLNLMDKFGKKLGCMFLQLPPNYGPKNFEDVINYLRYFPKQYELAVELRHPDWFKESAPVEELIQVLKEEGMSYVITDTAGRRDVCHMRLTTPVAFIRFVGNSLHPTDYSRIDAWAERIKQWLDQGLQKLYFFMHHHDERYSPELSIYLVEQLNSRCGLDLQVPKLLNKE